MFNTYIIIFIISYFISSISAFIDVDVIVRLESKGFHRLLHNNITIYGNVSTCAFLLKQSLSEHVYVNPRELDVLKDNNVLLTKLSDKVDTESMRQKAKPFVVWMYQKEPLLNSSAEYHSTLTFSLPIHVRYHEPKKGGGFVKFNIASPNLYANCSSPETGLVSSSGKISRISCSAFSTNLCDWIQISERKNSKPVEIEIPVGDIDHSRFVFWITNSVVIFGTFILLYTVTYTSKQ